MPVRAQGPRRFRWRWVLSVVASAVLLSLVTVRIMAPPADEGTPPRGHPTSRGQVPGEPLEVVDSAILTVPSTIRMDRGDFDARAGETYLLQFSATATKPAGSPGEAMYFGASLACGGPGGGTIRSVGGTQNVRTAEQVTIRNQFLLTVEDSGRHACRLSLNSPNEEAAASGTESIVDTRWSATRLDGAAIEAPPEDLLPRAIDERERAAAFRVDFDLEGVPNRELDLLGTLHVTTCTGTNGSREDGTTWCAEDDVDSAGSVLEVTYRTDMLDSSGEVCASTENVTTRARIVRFTHHRIIHVAHPATAPLSTCGDTARVVVEVQNDGPAPVVVHRSTSTLLLLSDT